MRLSKGNVHQLGHHLHTSNTFSNSGSSNLICSSSCPISLKFFTKPPSTVIMVFPLKFLATFNLIKRPEKTSLVSNLLLLKTFSFLQREPLQVQFQDLYKFLLYDLHKPPDHNSVRYHIFHIFSYIRVIFWFVTKPSINPTILEKFLFLLMIDKVGLMILYISKMRHKPREQSIK